MSFDSESFLKLCKDLREMGAAQVEGFGFKAIFPLAVPARTVAPPPAEPKRAELEQKTDEQLREEAYARELGQ